ncbi:MAG: hypothetical protein RQ798_01480 [Candidatus Caldarchaeales archaeon]|nr:hypothetical protein [Candidatus Caldarchaeales archaeon]
MVTWSASGKVVVSGGLAGAATIKMKGYAAVKRKEGGMVEVGSRPIGRWLMRYWSSTVEARTSASL